MKNQGLLIVISGPSGAGKGTVYGMVCARFPQIKKSVSVTTRKPRVGEVEGVHYYFKTISQYQQMISDGDFLETASVYDNFYGTPKAPVFEMLDNGDDVMFEIDVQGARQIKSKYNDAVSIFIMPPDFKVLEQRLRSRKTDSSEAISTRLSAARGELSAYKDFDYIVFNDRIEQAVDEVCAIITAERCAISRNQNHIKQLLK